MLLMGFEWKEKAENLEVELSESTVLKALLQEKENAIADMQKELTELRLLDVQSLIFTEFKFVIKNCGFKLMLQIAGNKRLKK